MSLLPDRPTLARATSDRPRPHGDRNDDRRGARSGPRLHRIASFALAVTLATLASAAAAHASLVSMEPAADTIVSEPPAVVALLFDEPVEVRFATLEVNRLDVEVAAEPDFLRLNGLAATRVEELLSDDDATRVDTGVAGDVTRSERVGLALRADLTAGAYVVSWRVLSVDGHPVEGHAVFVVAEGAN